MTDHLDWIFLGSAVDCEIRIAGTTVSGYHARCRMEPNGKVRIEDLGSPGGTAVNRPGARTVTQYLEPSDIVYLNAHPVAAATIYEGLQNRVRTTASQAPPPKPPPAQPRTASVPPPIPTEPTGPRKVSTDARPGVPPLRVERGVTVIGRDPDAMNKQRIVIQNPLLSRNHAGLLRTNNDEYYIWDLGSTYGTFIDSQRVGSRRMPVLPGQIIGIAGFRFTVGAEGGLAVAAASQVGIGIRVDGVAAEVGNLFTRRLNLEGIRLLIEPRTMLALMGASGAGKTTLLRILAGQGRPKSGRVFYNETELYAHFDQLRASLGYVPQEDILHPQLTVKQALFFSARLRLPADYSSAEIHRRVNETMVKLGIAGQADVQIGSAVKRGISGGQRKRTSLAMELLPDPAVLLLDEPTSGLSSADAERVIRNLRDLSTEGKTVIVTIHQPSREVFELFDRLAVIDNDTVRTSPPPAPQPGRLIFFGPAKAAPAYFQSQDTSGHSLSRTGADAVFTALEHNPGKTTPQWETAFRSSVYFRQYIEKPFQQASPASSSASQTKKTLPSPLYQFSTLLQRLWRIKSSDQWALWQMLALQPLLVAIGIAFASGSLHTEASYTNSEYVKDFLRIGKTLFFGVFVAIWFGCNNTAREIVDEIAIYRRERLVGLNLGAYLASKLVFFAGVCAIQCSILVGMGAIGNGLTANPAMLLLLYWLAALCGVGIGLFISALAPEGERAIQLVPLALLPMILFGGGVTRLVDLDTGFARKIAMITPARWTFEGTLLAENSNRPVSVPFNAASPQTAAQTVEERFTIVHHYFQESPHNDTRIWLCAAAVLLSGLVFITFAGLSLLLKVLH